MHANALTASRDRRTAGAFISNVTLHRTDHRRSAECIQQRKIQCVATKEAEIRDSRGAPAFISFPVDENSNAIFSGRGIVLLSDVMGYQDEHTQSVAKLAASTGLPTVVPDLFGGKPWEQGRDSSEYETWRKSLDLTIPRNAIVSASEELRSRESNVSIGLLGFCFGGGRLMEEIARAPDGLNPKAAVAFYPTRFDAAHVGRHAKCALLFITGDSDELVPENVVSDLHAAVSEHNKDMEECEIRVYEGAGHAFAHRPQSEQDQIDSQLSLMDAMEWLKKYL